MHFPFTIVPLDLLLLNKLIQQIDETPLDGKVFDREALEELSKEGVTLVSHLDLWLLVIFFEWCINSPFQGEFGFHVQSYADSGTQKGNIFVLFQSFKL